DRFLQMFGEILDNTLPLLRKGRYVGIVIGDKYSQGEWIPLGFHCLQEAQNRGLLLKSIIVKNFDQTKGKRNQKQLWRYRALAGGFYVFKHEYIFILRKD
ncbi:MAG: DNA methyltransferase, partial [Eubacteriales bacterium]|nr:DNA methyltransferase [Eubacteriales bacterium]